MKHSNGGGTPYCRRKANPKPPSERQRLYARASHRAEVAVARRKRGDNRLYDKITARLDRQYARQKAAQG